MDLPCSDSDREICFSKLLFKLLRAFLVGAIHSSDVDKQKPTNMALDSEHEPLIGDNPKLQSYYLSLESRVGYRLLLGGTRHFGFYERDTYWPFPFSRGLRFM